MKGIGLLIRKGIGFLIMKGISIPGGAALFFSPDPAVSFLSSSEQKRMIVTNTKLSKPDATHERSPFVYTNPVFCL